MRKDMAKVLCERPRGGWRVKRARQYRGPLEESPRRESMSMARGGTKYLNEHLGPLRRWLISKVGRHWNAVHSELRANISPKNPVQMHIWQHAEEMVARDVVRVDGVLMHRHKWAGVVELRSRQCPVYVCPKSGMVRRTPDVPRKRRA